jgi:two-component system sensor histidine kinase/response regulator
MPIMDGFEATRQIRTKADENARFATLPILAMTANATSGAKEFCLQAGMNDHIGKPIDVNQLFTTMARWIKPKTGPVNSANLADAADAADALETTDAAVTADAAVTVMSAGTAASISEAIPNLDLPIIPCLDLKQAMRHMGGNIKLIRKILVRFAETQANTMANITAAMDAGDLPSAIREAHTSKGLAGNIGATQLMALASTVEAALIQNQTDTLPEALSAMAQELGLIITQITEAIGIDQKLATNNINATISASVDRDVLTEQFQEFATLLTNNDTRAWKLANRITETMCSLGQDQAADRLKQLIAEYEFETALTTLTETAQTLDIPLYPQRTSI